MTKEAIEAMKQWQSISPTTCQCYTHYTKERPVAHRPASQAVTAAQSAALVPVPDNMVCERERAWRNYVKIRGEPVFENRGKIRRLKPDDVAFLNSVPESAGFSNLLN